MESIFELENRLDELFGVKELDQDPGFSKFIPKVYDPIGFDWRQSFVTDFVKRFNGLMLRGQERVHTVHLAVFPTDEILQKFIDYSQTGDLLFMHHPLDMECGDPKGQWGRGFVPIKTEILEAIMEKGLSVYTCHAPLDYNKRISTNLAIVNALDAVILEEFIPYGNGNAGVICEVETRSTSQLIEQLKGIFNIPYVDFEGKRHGQVKKIAIIAGCGDMVDAMQEAESMGVCAYITGEIHCHIDNDYGRKKFQQMKDYISDTSMSLIGVSHAASEYLVMERQMKYWFRDNFDLRVNMIPQTKWWR